MARAASSLILYFGAAQFAAISMLAGGAGLATMTLNTFVINLRHIFYGLPLLPNLPLKRWERLYAVFALTDESFSVLTTLPEPLRQPLFVPIAALNQFYWCSATVLGTLVGAGVGGLVPHLDFALVCLFVILGYEQYRSRKVWWPFVPAVAAFLLAKMVTAQYLMLTAMGVVTFALRAAPLVLPKAWMQSALLQALNFALPLCVMTLLVLSGLALNEAADKTLFLLK